MNSLHGIEVKQILLCIIALLGFVMPILHPVTSNNI